MLNRLLGKTAVLLLTLLLAAAGGAAAADTVKVGALKLDSSAPFFIGLEKGFFQQEGINVQMTWFSAAAPIVPALLTGDIDVGATGITPALYNAMAQGERLVVVADKGLFKQGRRSAALVVPKNSAIRSVKDLRGKKVAVTTLASTFTYMVGRLLEKEGMGLGDAQVTPLAQIPIIMESVKTGTVEAGVLPVSNANAMEADGNGRVLLWFDDHLTYQVSAVFYSKRFAKNRDLGVRFMKAYLRSVRYYHDAVFEEGKGARYDEVLGIISKYTGLEARDLARGLTYIAPDGRLLAKDLLTQQQWYKKHDLIQAIIPVEDMVDTDFVEEALAKLGQK